MEMFLLQGTKTSGITPPVNDPRSAGDTTKADRAKGEGSFQDVFRQGDQKAAENTSTSKGEPEVAKPVENTLSEADQTGSDQDLNAQETEEIATALPQEETISKKAPVAFDLGKTDAAEAKVFAAQPQAAEKVAPDARPAPAETSLSQKVETNGKTDKPQDGPGQAVAKTPKPTKTLGISTKARIASALLQSQSSQVTQANTTASPEIDPKTAQLVRPTTTAETAPAKTQTAAAIQKEASAQIPLQPSVPAERAQDAKPALEHLAYPTQTTQRVPSKPNEGTAASQLDKLGQPQAAGSMVKPLTAQTANPPQGLIKTPKAQMDPKMPQGMASADLSFPKSDSPVPATGKAPTPPLQTAINETRVNQALPAQKQADDQIRVSASTQSPITVEVNVKSETAAPKAQPLPTPQMAAPVAKPMRTESGRATDIPARASPEAIAKSIVPPATASLAQPQAVASFTPVQITQQPQLRDQMNERRLKDKSTPIAPPSQENVQLKQPQKITPAQVTIATPVIAAEPLGKDPKLHLPSSVSPDVIGSLSPDATTPMQQAQTTTPMRLDLGAHVARQIADVAHHLVNKPVDISLNPEELGRVRLSMTSSDAGLIVNVIAERPETLDLMRRHIAALDQEFQALGYEDVSFSFAGGEEQRSETEEHSQNISKTADLEPLGMPDAAPPPRSVVTDQGLDIRL